MLHEYSFYIIWFAGVVAFFLLCILLSYLTDDNHLSARRNRNIAKPQNIMTSTNMNFKMETKKMQEEPVYN
jgi:preprotein translocase subunit SecG